MATLATLEQSDLEKAITCSETLDLPLLPEQQINRSVVQYIASVEFKTRHPRPYHDQTCMRAAVSDIVDMTLATVREHIGRVQPSLKEIPTALLLTRQDIAQVIAQIKTTYATQVLTAYLDVFRMKTECMPEARHVEVLSTMVAKFQKRFDQLFETLGIKTTYADREIAELRQKQSRVRVHQGQGDEKRHYMEFHTG